MTRGAVHPMPDGRTLADSYHCSRYNLNTRRLTPEMFEAVIADVVQRLGDSAIRRAAVCRTHGAMELIQYDRMML